MKNLLFRQKAGDMAKGFLSRAGARPKLYARAASKYLGYRLAGTAAISVLLISALLSDVFSYSEYKLQDMWYERTGAVASPDIYVFGIDEKALDRFGRFEDWSRRRMAEAIEILNGGGEYRPAVIAIDVLYLEESGDREADMALAGAAAKAGNVVLASLVTFGMDTENISTDKIVTDHETPYPELARGAAYGISNGTFDTDGLIRSATLKAMHGGRPVYGFPYEVYKKYTGGETIDFVEENHELYITYSEEPGGYYGPEGMGLSFADIFDEGFDPAFFADGIVFIGPYASGFMDSYYTPASSDAQMYGVEVHANVTQMLIDGNFKTRVSKEANLLILLLLIALETALARKADIRVLLCLAALAAAGYLGFAGWLFDRGYILALLYPLLALAAVYAYELIYGYVAEAVEKRRIKLAFMRYVDARIVDRLIETADGRGDEIGVKRHIAVLFVDLRGFTAMSEKLREQPETVARILNEYFELTSTAVFENGGSVDKFIGDSTMALFNGFVPLDDYVFGAVKSAFDMIKGAGALNASLKEKYGVDLGFGIGINCGEAIVGNLGSSFRKDYTAVGDTVNIAARLESTAASSQILISKDVYDRIKDRIEAVSLGEISLKGKSIKLEVFSVGEAG